MFAYLIRIFSFFTILSCTTHNILAFQHDPFVFVDGNHDSLLELAFGANDKTMFAFTTGGVVRIWKKENHRTWHIHESIATHD